MKEQVTKRVKHNTIFFIYASDISASAIYHSSSGPALDSCLHAAIFSDQKNRADNAEISAGASYNHPRYSRSRSVHTSTHFNLDPETLRNQDRCEQEVFSTHHSSVNSPENIIASHPPLGSCSLEHNGVRNAAAAADAALVAAAKEIEQVRHSLFSAFTQLLAKTTVIEEGVSNGIHLAPDVQTCDLMRNTSVLSCARDESDSYQEVEIQGSSGERTSEEVLEVYGRRSLPSSLQMLSSGELYQSCSENSQEFDQSCSRRCPSPSAQVQKHSNSSKIAFSRRHKQNQPNANSLTFSQDKLGQTAPAFSTDSAQLKMNYIEPRGSDTMQWNRWRTVHPVCEPPNGFQVLTGTQHVHSSFKHEDKPPGLRVKIFLKQDPG